MSRSALLVSGVLLVVAPPAAGADFIRGDSNASGGVEISDAIHLLNYLFLGGEGPSCLDAADSNDDGSLNVSDAIHCLFFLFAGGVTMPPPGLECGPDPTDGEGLGCLDFAPCRPCPSVPTPSQTEGPYFKAGSPLRASLIEAGVEGTGLVLSGRVLSRTCRGITDARVDFWHADQSGAYDNAGYRLRGHQLTDAGGGYRLETIMPGLYPGRTRHIHVKVTPPGQPVLTTQLYFPGEPRNATDGIYRRELEVSITGEGSQGKQATFDFVMDQE